MSPEVLLGRYDYRLVVLSVLIAVLASFSALELAGRVTAAKSWTRTAWIAGGATAMGTGIWSMHYIGMLAFTLPVSVRYNLPTVLLSLVAAVIASAVALIVVSRPTMGMVQAFIASLLMGGGIASMHYIGMAAMRLPAICTCTSGLVWTSIVVAIVISLAAILLTFRFRGKAMMTWQKSAAALLMGAAIPVMHYTGMAAANFRPAPAPGDYATSITISDLGVFGIALITVVVLATALLTAAIDRRFGIQALELEDSERRYRQLVDAAQVVLWRCDAKTSKFNFVSLEAERLLGYPVHQWLNNPEFWVSRIHADDRTNAIESYERAALHGQSPAFEHRMIAADGREVWLRTSIGAVGDTGQDLVAAMLDITQVKRAERELWQQRDLVDALITTVPDSIYFKDLESRFVLINPPMAKLLSLSNCTEAIGKSDSNFFDDSHAARTRRDELEIICTGQGIVDQEEKESWPDGRVTWASSTKMPLIDMNGQTIGTLGISRNITSRKLAEAELQQRTAELMSINDRLQQEITERAMLEGQLVQAQKLESIGQLAAGIAHELNTPIQYVGDNIRFLLDAYFSVSRVLQAQGEVVAEAARAELLPELVAAAQTSAANEDLEYLIAEVPRALDQCAEGVSRVASIVMAMKEFSHPGKVEQESIDINHAIESTLVVCRNEWKYVAEAVTDLEPGLAPVKCFPGEFNQVILNLVVNAAHAVTGVQRGDAHKGTITVSTHSATPWVEIRVTDNGTGIPAAARSKIFTPFFTTKEIGKGTGQGLSMARSVIVKRHQGTIAFETEEDIGTTFTIRLPIAGLRVEGAV